MPPLYGSLELRSYGFVFDFCGVEIDRDAGTVRADKCVTVHGAGQVLNPALLEAKCAADSRWRSEPPSTNGSFMTRTAVASPAAS